VIERHVEFSVNYEAGEAFEIFFAQEYRPAMACQEGFRDAHLLRDQDDCARYQMVIRFDTLEQAAYWRASDDHRELQPRLKSLYSSSGLAIFDVVA